MSVLCCVFYVKTVQLAGHVDFYPGAEDQFGWEQPGCWRVSFSTQIRHAFSCRAIKQKNKGLNRCYADFSCHAIKQKSLNRCYADFTCLPAPFPFKGPRASVPVQTVVVGFVYQPMLPMFA